MKKVRYTVRLIFTVVFQLMDFLKRFHFTLLKTNLPCTNSSTNYTIETTLYDEINLRVSFLWNKLFQITRTCSPGELLLCLKYNTGRSASSNETPRHFELFHKKRSTFQKKCIPGRPTRKIVFSAEFKTELFSLKTCSTFITILQCYICIYRLM